MSLNKIRAILIINAKKAGGSKNPKMKGWTDEARKKAALTRKAKAKAGAKGALGSLFSLAPKAFHAKAAPKAKNKTEKALMKIMDSHRPGIDPQFHKAALKMEHIKKDKKLTEYHKATLKKLKTEIASAGKQLSRGTQVTSQSLTKSGFSKSGQQQTGKGGVHYIHYKNKTGDTLWVKKHKGKLTVDTVRLQSKLNKSLLS